MKDNCYFWSQRQSRAIFHEWRTQQILFFLCLQGQKKSSNAVCSNAVMHYAQMLLILSFSYQATLLLIKQTIYSMLVLLVCNAN